jgi:hypothetical protein
LSPKPFKIAKFLLVLITIVLALAGKTNSIIKFSGQSSHKKMRYKGALRQVQGTTFDRLKVNCHPIL